ncbi:DNA phosphorothioation-dependent restriction protein DptG [Phytophthora palmivora]|uniref:DNA phosphorothioation-dependent restriction protein DptG n=1 Tax=Phytophthora palmivora TaxID=4796 RepID=A0A2P4XTV4_9STRA|nr:DNA phosphorothioation-dependent restriction protein DptG [Phytophthora palmivora]
MVINAGVMIREYFYKRLRLYVQITFGGLGSALTKKQKKEKADLVKTILHAFHSTDKTDVTEALQKQDVLTPDGVEWGDQWIPWANHIKENGMVFYVRPIWGFQGAVESRMDETEEGKASDKKSAEKNTYVLVDAVSDKEDEGNTDVGNNNGRATNHVGYAAYLLEFWLNRPFLKWKFFQKRMARIAVDEISRRIVPNGLKQALQKRTVVVSMDEFRASKLCSQCHQTLSPVHYPVNTMLPRRKKRNGAVLVRNRAEVQFEEKKCHGVLHCDHTNSNARYWDRDVNAAIKMVELLKSEVLGWQDVAISAGPVVNDVETVL